MGMLWLAVIRCVELVHQRPKKHCGEGYLHFQVLRASNSTQQYLIWFYFVLLDVQQKKSSMNRFKAGRAEQFQHMQASLKCLFRVANATVFILSISLIHMSYY